MRRVSFVALASALVVTLAPGPARAHEETDMNARVHGYCCFNGTFYFGPDLVGTYEGRTAVQGGYSCRLTSHSTTLECERDGTYWYQPALNMPTRLVGTATLQQDGATWSLSGELDGHTLDCAGWFLPDYYALTGSEAGEDPVAGTCRLT